MMWNSKAKRLKTSIFCRKIFNGLVKKSEEMSFQELYHYVQDVEAEGYDATPYRVDFHGKFALPVACLILCIIGTGITLRKNTPQGLSMTIIYGITVVFLYWISQSFCLSLGVWRYTFPGHCGLDRQFYFCMFCRFNLGKCGIADDSACICTLKLVLSTLSQFINHPALPG